MNRRAFLSTSLAGQAILGAKPNPPAVKSGSGGKLGSYSLDKIRDQYRYDLFQDFLPFMEKHVIDHEYGGFMCNTDRDGTKITKEKTAWYEGRGIWVYSFLYNNLAKEREYLEVSRKSLEFVLKHMPSGDSTWPKRFTREGEAIGGPDPEIWGDLYIAEGLAEYSRATGDPKYWDMAKDIMLKCVRIYDRPDYYAPSYTPPKGPLFPGARIQGVWMVLVSICTKMLETKKDPDVERIAARCVDAVMNYHFNPEFQLNNELLNHDLSRPTNEYAQLVYTGDAIEALWMLLYEAARLKDKKLFHTFADRFRRHVEVALDRIYGGVFHELRNVDQNIWAVDKVLYPQEGVLIGSLFVVEHTGAQWAKNMFAEQFGYVQAKYPLKRYSLPLWTVSSDRRVTFQRHSNRIEHFHHPRHLMLNLLCVERMIERKGRISGLFA